MIDPAARWVLIAALVGACTSSTPFELAAEWDPDGELTTGMRVTPLTIDPQRTGIGQIRHSAMVFEGLMTFDPKTLRPVAAAAKGSPKVSGDGLTYSFTLRDGLKYSDGSPLGARDFAYGFMRSCSLGDRLLFMIPGCEELSRLDPAKTSAEDLAVARGRFGVQAIGERDLVITLIEPASHILLMAAFPNTYPIRETDVAKAAESYGSDPLTLVGNGPFRLVELVRDDRIVFERNEHYRTPPRLKRWRKVVVRDDVAFAAYQNNEIDMYGGIPSGRLTSVAGKIAAIEASPELRAQLVDLPAAVTHVFLLNVTKPPFTDKRVRQAFAKAVDRELHIRALTKFGEPAHSAIPPGQPGHDSDDRFQAFDPVRAKELLAASSFAERPELSTIRLGYAAPSDTIAPFEWFQQQMKANLGVEIALEPIDVATFGAVTSDPRTHPHLRFFSFTNEGPDPQRWLSRAFHSSSALMRGLGYRNPELDARFGEADRERDSQRRSDLYRRASRMLSEDAVAIWHWWPRYQYLRKPHVHGVTDTAGDYEYGFYRFSEIYVTRKK